MKEKKQEMQNDGTKKYDIFISYRREGGFEFAEKLHKRLLEDGYVVAFDKDMGKGRFDKALLSRIEACTDFIVVLNKGCFDRTLDASFPPEKDWMRKELAHALKMKKNVVTVMLTGFDWPNGLPDDIRDVEFMNGPKYDPVYFASFYDELKEKFLESKSQVAAGDTAAVNQQLDLPILGKPVDEKLWNIGLKDFLVGSFHAILLSRYLFECLLVGVQFLSFAFIEFGRVFHDFNLSVHFVNLFLLLVDEHVVILAIEQQHHNECDEDDERQA